jgi:hypothetical protein
MSTGIDHNIKRICKQVAIEQNLPDVVVMTIYYNYCKTLKTEIEKLELKDPNKSLTEEEFNRLPTSFNIRYLGKIYTEYKTYINKKSINYGSSRKKN